MECASADQEALMSLGLLKSPVPACQRPALIGLGDSRLPEEVGPLCRTHATFH